MASPERPRAAESIEVGGTRIFPGSRVEVPLKLSEQYLGGSLATPLYVLHGKRPGPALFVTAAIHGDEVNGVASARGLLRRVKADRLAGTLFVLPVANLPAFLTNKRVLPDGRDLNRLFPGRKNGSSAARVAWRLWDEVVARADYGIDLHTAGRFRTNAPHIRGDLADADVRLMARAFGTSVVLDHPGCAGSLRREATRAGVPTILFEGGETLRFQHRVVRAAVHGILNVMDELGMISFKRAPVPWRVIAKSSTWVRASAGGILELRVKPGQPVERGKVLAFVRPPFGRVCEALRAPCSGVVIGMSTRPMAMPGDAVVHVVQLARAFELVRRRHVA